MSERGSREHEYWTPEPIFAGETVFCLASGPSLTPAIAAKLRGRRCVVVNSSCLLAPWANMLFFTDSSWYENHRAIVRDWPGLVVSMSRTAKIELPDKVKRVKGEGDPYFPIRDFPPPGQPVVRQGRSSGHTAAGLPVSCGARRVVLLGYDMRIVDGREHCHDDYRDGPARDVSIYPNFAAGFAGWNRAALDRGVDILNATPGSAVTEFPMVDIEAVLQWA